MIRKFLLAALVVLMIVSAMPARSVFAAPVGEDPNPDRGKDADARLEKAFQRVQDWYEKQGEFLGKTDEYIAKAETLISKAEQRGLDTSSLRSLLESFKSIGQKMNKSEGTAGLMVNDPKLYQSLVDSAKQMSLVMTDLKRLVEQWEQEGLALRLK